MKKYSIKITFDSKGPAYTRVILEPSFILAFWSTKKCIAAVLFYRDKELPNYHGLLL